MEKKKSNLTNTNYQRQFLPYLQKAETEIKKAIVNSALTLKSKTSLRKVIQSIIKAVDEKLPPDLKDRKLYLNGLYYSSERNIKEFYDKATIVFLIALKLLKDRNEKRYKNIEKPIELIQIYNKDIFARRDMSLIGKRLELEAAAKGYPHIPNYPAELRKSINKLSNSITLVGDKDKQHISIWSKAELDLRHDHQLNMIKDLKEDGVRYAWISTHPNCSKRCQRWQGKLFDLNAPHAEQKGFRMNKKIDGNTVYCFKDVIHQVDKYGYQNNIIVGFNCRHKLIPYKSNSVAPVEFTAKEIEENRAINDKLRQYERTIRALRQESTLLEMDNPKQSKLLKTKADILYNRYRNFANKNGYAFYEWRCK